MGSEPMFDIAIYGSTSGAVASAIQGARLGLNVALVSPSEHIGGIQVEGLGATDIDNQAEFQNSCTLGGLSLELHQRISTHYGRLERLSEVVKKGIKDPSVWRFEARVAEEIIKNWLNEFSNIHITKASLDGHIGVVKKGTKITGIRLSNGTVISAKYYIEASYEGDLLAAAGASTTYGRESTSTYGESLAGVRDQTIYRQFDKPVDPYRIPGDPSSGLLFGISPEPFGKPGQGDKHFAAFSYRLPLTNVKSNMLPIYKPEGYDPDHYELHRRYANAGGQFYLPNPRVPNVKTDLIGSEATLATDLIGMNDDWATGNAETRQRILEETTLFTKGLMYFFTSDPSLPAEMREEWSKWGYCLDEFPDNNHFPRQLYVRDARRMISDYNITEHTASRDNGEEPVPDPVAVAYWPTDTHCARRVVRDGVAHNEGFIFKDGHKWRPFGIAYRALVPRKSEAENLMTATCPSSSHVGYGAVRLEHQFYALGQACANACEIALKSSLPIQDVPYSGLRARLVKQGVVIDAGPLKKPSFSDE